MAITMDYPEACFSSNWFAFIFFIAGMLSFLAIIVGIPALALLLLDRKSRNKQFLKVLGIAIGLITLFYLISFDVYIIKDFYHIYLTPQDYFCAR